MYLISKGPMLCKARAFETQPPQPFCWRSSYESCYQKSSTLSHL